VRGLQLEYADVVCKWNPFESMPTYGLRRQGTDRGFPAVTSTSYWARSDCLRWTRDAGAAPTDGMPDSARKRHRVGALYGVFPRIYRRERVPAKDRIVTTSAACRRVWSDSVSIQASAVMRNLFGLPRIVCTLQMHAVNVYRPRQGWPPGSFIVTPTTRTTVAKAIGVPTTIF